MRVYWYNSLVLLGLFQALLALSGAVFTFASTKSLWDHPAFKKKAIETTQKLMLSALGLTEFPRPGPEMVPHEYMVELYDRLSRGEHQGSDTEQVKTVRAYADQERLDSSTLHANHQGYVFNLTALPSSEHVLAADLRILRQATGKEAAIQKYGTDYRVSIYGKPENYSASFSLYESPTWKLLNYFSFDIRHREDKWNVLSVKRAVELWQQKTQTVQLLLRVESLKSGELVPPEDVGFSREGRPRDKQALLVVFLAHENTKTSKENKRTSNATLQKSADLRKEERTKNSSDSSPRVRRGASGQGDKSASRKARQGSRPKRRRRRELCRRKPLYVDFKQLGWSNWVIAPDGYNAYFCEGLCEFPIQEHYKPTNHAVVQTIMNSVNPVLAPKACCIPNKLNAISILYVDSNDNLIYKKYEEMVVERCGCN